MQYKKIQIKILNVFLTAALVFANAVPASAGLFGGGGGGIKMPSASQIASELEQRYHLNLGSIQNQGESFNVGDNKKLAPEVTLFFSPSDPKEGEKISAKAFPVYFSNSEESLYYTWYLKRSGCDIDRSPSKDERDLCDSDEDGRITVEDWKIEAARLLVQNGYDSSETDYGSDNDDDGYRARFGGDNKANTPDYCYVHDASSGTLYELSDGTSDLSFGCPSGTSPVCMVGQGSVDANELDFSATGEAFSVSDSESCYVSGLPACTSGVPVCNTGSPRCVANPVSATTCGSALDTCSSSESGDANPVCEHLFPNGSTSGNGSFGAAEERFWGTDPNDPDTADNGNKDEANVVGLGQSTFTWNYAPGDKVGVVVEGTSMLQTKHNDSSSMIMWAFSRKDCPITLAESSGSYSKNIKGYSVNIPTAKMDLNDCLERNLVDPTQGGQATNLEVNVTATPDNPVNDETSDEAGDTVMAQAGISNGGHNTANTQYEWRVELSNSIRFTTSVDITSDMQSLGLLGNSRGNALDVIKLKLDIPSRFGGKTLTDYLINGMGYLRFSVRATENFSSGVTRKGRGDIIVKFISTSKKISAYKAATQLRDGSMKTTLSGAPGICNDIALDRNACRVIRNEIVGLRVDPSGLGNFKWMVNGSPLSCGSAVSADCSDTEQNEVNFFPVTGNVGDTYVVTVSANDVATGKNVTLSRSFHIVEPQVSIVTRDESVVWPKLLGQYRDITGTATNCPGGLCNDYSTTILQAFSGSTIGLRAQFLPGFLGSIAEREWLLDGQVIQETSSGSGEINFEAVKPAPGIYNISLNASAVQSTETRRALFDIWNISPLDSPEISFSVANQIELSDPNISASGNGNKKFFAALSSYVPASVMFVFRIFLSAALILFVTGFLFSLIPEPERPRSY